MKQVPEPYPYTNQPVSSFKHGELVLSGADPHTDGDDDGESIDDYDYLKHQTPLTPATDQDSDKLLEFYRNIEDSKVSKMLLQRHQDRSSTPFSNEPPQQSSHLTVDSKK
jgi:hypothetical protein